MSLEQENASPRTSKESHIHGDLISSTQSHLEKGDRPQQPLEMENSLQGWLAVLGGSLVTLSTFGNLQSFGVFQDFYTRHFLTGYSASQISLIGSLALSLQFLVGVLSGKLFDAGHFHLLMVSGTVLLLFSIFMLSLAHPDQYYQVILSQGVGMGVGSGLLFLPSLSIVAHYFKRRRAVAMGIVVASGSLGGVIYPIILNKVIPTPHLGFPWAIRFIGFINAVFLIVANLITKPRPYAGRKEPVVMAQILRDKPYWLAVAGVFFSFWGLYIPYFYLQLFSIKAGVDPKFLTWTIPLLNAGAVLGRFCPNFLADVYGPLNTLIPSGIISGSLVWALLGVHNVAGVTLFALVYGFASGSIITLVSPAVASFSVSPTLSDVGLRIGITSFFGGIALLSGNPIAGALLTSEYIWWRPLTFSCVTVLLGTALFTAARQGMIKRKGVQYV